MVRLRAPWLAYLLAGLAAVGAYYLLPFNSLGQTVLYDGVGASSALAILVGAIANRPARRLPWLMFAAGIAAFSVGDVIFNNWEPSSPSVADAFYLGGYPLLAAGFALLIRELRATQRRYGLLEAAIFTVAFALCQWIFVMDQLTHGPRSAAGEAVALAYPAMDVVLLSALAVLLMTPAWRTTAYRYLAASLVLLVVADEIYGVSPNSYPGASWLDSLWLLSYIVWGVAALHPSMKRLTEVGQRVRPRLGVPRSTLLAAGLLTAPVVLVIERATDRPLHPIAIAVGATVLSLLVLVRLAALVEAVDRLRIEEHVARSEAETTQRLLAEQNARLREADRMKDEFVALISHDLRTPLTSIVGYLDLTMESTTLTEEERGYLAVVERNSQRLLALVNDLLFVARLEAGEFELHVSDLDLAAIAQQAVEEAQPRARVNDITLSFDAENVDSVQGDRGRMFQLLDNLISNAIKFTPSGGHVAVRVVRTDNGSRLSVADTGIGISAAEQNQLFQRFFRTTSAVDRQIPGTGLGLYIARAIVEAHGGAISVESVPGAGTTFVAELPFALDRAAAVAELVT
jgi:signal transduction histidine kinase